MSKYTIIGAGPAGLSIAYYLKNKRIKFEIFESSKKVGGNCITIKHNDFYFDSGAHRLHDKDPETTQIFKNLLKEELKEINIPSQIFVKEKYVDFPISPLNLLNFFGLKTFLIEGIKVFIKSFTKHKQLNNFYDNVVSIYGLKIANLFLINYSQKLWGLEANRLSNDISGKRLKGLNFKTFILEFIFSSKVKTKHLDGSFLYPDYGIGTLFDKLATQIGTRKIKTNCNVKKINHDNNIINSIEINNKLYPISNLISTMPLDKFIFSLSPSPPQRIIKLTKSIKFRNLILVAVFLNKKSINNNGSIYFPSSKYPFTRIYEPRNRSKLMSPLNKTSLIVEIPCFSKDQYWSMQENQISKKILDLLIEINFFSKSEIISSKTYKINNAYPVLELDFDKKIIELRNYLKKFKNLKISGRNGLFSYSHIHDQFINAREIVNELN